MEFTKTRIEKNATFVCVDCDPLCLFTKELHLIRPDLRIKGGIMDAVFLPQNTFLAIYSENILRIVHLETGFVCAEQNLESFIPNVLRISFQNKELVMYSNEKIVCFFNLNLQYLCLNLTSSKEVLKNVQVYTLDYGKKHKSISFVLKLEKWFVFGDNKLTIWDPDFVEEFELQMVVIKAQSINSTVFCLSKCKTFFQFKEETLFDQVEDFEIKEYILILKQNELIVYNHDFEIVTSLNSKLILCSSPYCFVYEPETGTLFELQKSKVAEVSFDPVSLGTFELLEKQPYSIIEMAKQYAIDSNLDGLCILFYRHHEVQELCGELIQMFQISSVDDFCLFLTDTIVPYLWKTSLWTVLDIIVSKSVNLKPELGLQLLEVVFNVKKDGNYLCCHSLPIVSDYANETKLMFEDMIRLKKQNILLSCFEYKHLTPKNIALRILKDFDLEKAKEYLEFHPKFSFNEVVSLFLEQNPQFITPCFLKNLDSNSQCALLMRYFEQNDEINMDLLEYSKSILELRNHVCVMETRLLMNKYQFKIDVSNLLFRRNLINRICMDPLGLLDALYLIEMYPDFSEHFVMQRYINYHSNFSVFDSLKSEQKTIFLNAMLCQALVELELKNPQKLMKLICFLESKNVKHEKLQLFKQQHLCSMELQLDENPVSGIKTRRMAKILQKSLFDVVKSQVLQFLFQKKYLEAIISIENFCSTKQKASLEIIRMFSTHLQYIDADLYSRMLNSFVKLAELSLDENLSETMDYLCFLKLQSKILNLESNMDFGLIMNLEKIVPLCSEFIVYGLLSLIELKTGVSEKKKDVFLVFKDAAETFAMELIKSRNLWTALEVLSLLQLQIMYQEKYNQRKLKTFDKKIMDCMRQISVEMGKERVIDAQILFGYLIQFDSSQAFSLIDGFLKGEKKYSSKSSALTSVACALCRHFQEPKIQEYKKRDLVFYWMGVFLKLGIVCDQYRSLTFWDLNATDYICPLIEKGSPSLALGYVHSFQIPESCFYESYLRVLFQGKDYKKFTFFGKIKVPKLYLDIMHQISPYDYEKLKFLIERGLDSAIETNDAHFKESFLRDANLLDTMLDFEKPNYSEDEVNLALENNWDPEMARKRLSFHEMSCKGWKYFKKFVSEESVLSSSKIIKFLVIRPDEVYGQVLMNELQLKKSKICFLKVKKYLSYIQDPVIVAAVCQHFASKMVGENRIQALKLDYFYSEQLLKNNDIKLNLKLKKQQILYAELELELKKHNLEIQMLDYKDTIKNVYLLYLKSKNLDLHSICENLAQSAELDIHKIRWEIIESFLETFDNDEFLVYLCQKNKKYLKRLDEISTSKSSTPAILRVRALSILIKSAPKREKAAINHFVSLIKALLHFIDFEALHITVSSKDILNFNKNVLHYLWSKYKNDPKAIQIILNLCIEHSIKDPTIISAALQFLLDANEFKYILQNISLISTLLQDGENAICLFQQSVMRCAYHLQDPESLRELSRNFVSSPLAFCMLDQKNTLNLCRILQKKLDALIMVPIPENALDLLNLTLPDALEQSRKMYFFGRRKIKRFLYRICMERQQMDLLTEDEVREANNM